MTELIIDGKPIAINQFVQEVLAGVTGGILSSIHGVQDDWTSAEIKITRNR